MRHAAATVAAVLAVVAALSAAVLWTAGRNTLDDGRFSDRVVASLASTPGRGALALTLGRQLRDRTTAEFSNEEVYTSVGRAVDAIADRPAFRTALAAAVARAHRAIVENPGEPVAIDLGALRAQLVRVVAERNPALAAEIPPASAFPDIRVATGLDVPAVPGSRLAGHVPVLVALLALASFALLALAIVVSERAGRTARRLSAAMMLLAPVPAAIGLLAPRAAGAAVAPPADELARDLAERLLAPWVPATVALVVAAIALFAVGAISGGAGPRIRPPAG